jgi:hypothetical protein
MLFVITLFCFQTIEELLSFFFFFFDMSAQEGEGDLN